jgi:hypothetical protein
VCSLYSVHANLHLHWFTTVTKCWPQFCSIWTIYLIHMKFRELVLRIASSRHRLTTHSSFLRLMVGIESWNFWIQSCYGNHQLVGEPWMVVTTVVPVHAMTALGAVQVYGYLLSFIMLALDMSVLCFTLRPHYPQRKSSGSHCIARCVNNSAKLLHMQLRPAS